MAHLDIVLGDITRFRCDAIVNAANSSLSGGGGVDGAIHRVGGPEILKECRALVVERGRLATGEAVATTAGRLPARYVIHTVGPIWGSVTEQEAIRLLGNAYRKSLELAVVLDARTVAFPNISTGVYGFPKALAAETAVGSVLATPALAVLDRVTFVCFDEENLHLYQKTLATD